jgi:hypothetical protein
LQNSVVRREASHNYPISTIHQFPLLLVPQIVKLNHSSPTKSTVVTMPLK